MRSGGYATVAYVSFIVDVESVRSFGQTGNHSGNRHRTGAIGLNESDVAGHLTGSLEDDNGSALLLNRKRKETRYNFRIAKKKKTE